MTRDIDFFARNPNDQYGYLGNARWLSGDPRHHLLPQMAYYGFGYSLLLVPAFWLFDGPGPITHAVLAVNAVLGAALFPLLYLFCRHTLRHAPRHALLAAGVGALSPAALFNPSLALAENLILPLTAATVLSFWLFVSPRPAWQRAWFGPSLALLLATHDRHLLLVVVGVGAMVAAARVRLVSRALAAYNIAVAAILMLASVAVRAALLSDRWVEGELSTNQLGRVSYYTRLLDPDELYRLLLEAVGHAWYLMVGTLGLAAIGLFHLVARTRRVEGEGDPWYTDPAKSTIAFLLAGAVAMFLTSTLYFTRIDFPSEGYIYGRYNEPFVQIWIASGAAFVLTAERRRLLLAGVVGLLATAGLFIALVAGRSPSELEAFYTPVGVPDVARFADPPGQLVATATWVCMAGLGLLIAVILASRRPAVLLLPLALWLAFGGATEVAVDAHYEDWRFPRRVANLDIDRAAVNLDADAGVPPHYQFFLPDLYVERWQPQNGAPGEPFVFDNLDSAALRRAGARIVLIDDEPTTSLLSGYILALWAMPGPEANQLDREGKLLPAGFPKALPAPARRAELRLTTGSAGRNYTVRTGEELRIQLEGRHTGAGSPWPDLDSYDRPGRVRVGARPLSTDYSVTTRAIPREGAGELQGWVYPGDGFSVDLRLAAVDIDGNPLPPGRYEYEIGLVQPGFEWFRPPGAAPLRVTLRVT
ncbi:MAG: hypothetical protein ABIP36_00840 [Acidimicrobiales bacterium]